MKALRALAAAAFIACAPTALAPEGTSTPAVSGASVVTLVRPQARWSFGSLASENWTRATWRIGYVPSCNAFAVEHAGSQHLATAAHCVDGLKLGEAVLYLSPDGVGYGHAILSYVDPAKDVAFARASGLHSLPRSSVPREGEAVLSVSSLYSSTSYGRLLSHLSMGYYETTQTIIHGWSGSPVFDARGRVWGVVSKCTQNAGANECEPGRAIVADLP